MPLSAAIRAALDAMSSVGISYGPVMPASQLWDYSELHNAATDPTARADAIIAAITRDKTRPRLTILPPVDRWGIAGWQTDTIKPGAHRRRPLTEED